MHFSSQGKSTKTMREYWQELMKIFEEKCPNKPIYADFISFAEAAMDFTLIFDKIKPPKISTGSKETLWGSAFHLYSGLGFFKNNLFDVF